MRSAFNLLIFPNSMFHTIFYMKGLCALWRNSTKKLPLLLLLLLFVCIVLFLPLIFANASSFHVLSWFIDT